MSNQNYYERWLKMKSDINNMLDDDKRLQHFAVDEVGIKPQATAVEIVSRVYAKYCNLFNRLCDMYDQMHQVQRAEYIKKLIDAMTCRILELKLTLQKVECFEITYPDNALQQLIMIPEDIQIMVPFFYPYEIRQAEMQYIADQIFSGNRIGDPLPTKEEEEQLEKEKLEKEKQQEEEKEAARIKKLALNEESIESIIVAEELLTPEELKELEFWTEYNKHLFNIQRMERSRVTLRHLNKKKNKDADMYLELTGVKKKSASIEVKTKAAKLIERIYRSFMHIKREHVREDNLKEIIEMTIPTWSPPSAKVQLEKVKQTRREFRRMYYQQWIEKHITEKTKVLRLREHNIMEDISDEIREWFLNWYSEFKVFDEFPYPGEGGSILIVKGETMSLEEYEDWRDRELKRLKAAGNNPKTKEQIKKEKAEAKADKRRIAKEEALKEKKRQSDYKKSRMNPETDPGVRLKIGACVEPVVESWGLYENQWNAIDRVDASLDAIRGYIMSLVAENVYEEIHLQLRPIVDEAMRLELAMLKKANIIDFKEAEKPIPPIQKRRKPPKPKKVRPERIPPERMFQELVDKGIIRQYPKISLEEFWADSNYASAETRAVPWVPTFPPPCLGDIKDHLRIQCLLALGSSCENANRSQLIIGPKNSGKKMLVYAVASETNSILIDLSPVNTRGKYSGKKLRRLFFLVNRISRLMQPTVIMVDHADSVFYKRVPKEERLLDPTLLQRNFVKLLIKPLSKTDRILVLGTACQPWTAKKSITKAFPAIILMPRTDYGSISFILTKLLMKYRGVNREFDVHSTAQCLQGYDVHCIKKAVETVMHSKRIAALTFNPLHPKEILDIVLNDAEAIYTSQEDYQLYQNWYLNNSEWGKDYLYLMEMLECQLKIKLKNDLKNKKKKKASRMARSSLSLD